MAFEPILNLRGVSKTFGGGHTKTRAVSAVDLTVLPQEICLIMGPSGSGKTTLLSIAGCLLKPDEGEVEVDGKRVDQLSERRLPRVRLEKIGFVFQSFNLLSALTALENVRAVLRFAGQPRRFARDRSAELLRQLGLEERMHHYPDELSGGEKQRVAIARALANEPDLLLADEPTANLDSKTGHVVVKLLHKIAQEQKIGVVIVSHDMRIMDIADRVLQLEDGRLWEGAMALAKDPVCGMVIAEDKAAATLKRGEKTYYFCSQACKDKFSSGRRID